MSIYESQIDVISKFIDGCKNNICYVSLPKNLSDKLVGHVGSDFVVIDLLRDFSPFKPFLSILREKHPDEALITEKSYSVQTETFLSFFRTGCATERFDIPIENEFIYETNRFVQTICALLQELNETNFLILNSQLLPQNSLAIIKELEKRSLKGRFVFCFDTDQPSESTNITSEFFESNSNKRNFLYLKEKFSATNDSVLPEISQESVKRKLLSDYDSLFINLRNNRLFMSHEQLKQIIDWADTAVHKMDIGQKELRALYLEIALAYYACLQYDKAILFLNDILDFHEKDEIDIAALYYLVAIFNYKKNSEYAKRYANHLQARLKTNNDSPYAALYEMTEFQFCSSADLEDNTEKYKHILKILEARGFINNYISTGLSIPWSLINTAENREFVDGTIDKCYKLAKEIDNQHLVSKACHWKGIIHSHYGEGEEAMKWYFECNQIRTEIGEIVPIMNIRNGLCYESTLRSKYENAYNLVNDVIKNLYSMSDYSTVIDTLKNISYALFYSRHFAQANSIFTRILRYLHLFNLDERPSNSFLPSVNDMLIFKSIVAINENDYIHARINYSRILHDNKDITSEDYPLLHFVKAALFLDDGNLDEALNAIEESIAAFKTIASDQSHKICFVCFESAVLLARLGFVNESEKYLEIGFNLAREKSLEHYCKHKQVISVYDYLHDMHDFAPLNIDLLFLDEKADKEVLLTQLHKRIHDYQFLSRIKATNLKNLTLKQYIQNVSSEIFEFTLAKAVIFSEFKNGRFETINGISQNNDSRISKEKWMKIFEQNSGQLAGQFVYISDENLFFADISQYDYRFGIIIIPSEENPLGSDYINTLNIAISNIQAQLIIFKQNENLLFLSSTDQLSLLNNRHSLQLFISQESDKIRRYRERKSANIQISIAFIDLDNFKYYNDTFGHSTGDLLISCFSKLLKQTCRHIDFISRFGGDEFVIVMTDTSIDEALKVYRRLKGNLSASDFFIPEIKRHLNDNSLQIPDDKHLDFSMGICSNFDDGDFADLNNVMAKADQALYYSKEHNKGQATVWKDMPKKAGL